MNKYIYRILFVIFLILYFFWYEIFSGIKGAIALLLIPLMLIICEIVGLFTGQPSNPFGDVSPLNDLIVNIFLMGLMLSMAYWFMISWVKAELVDHYLPIAKKVLFGFFFWR